MPDLYFEIGIMIENLGKSYGVPNANYYFRVNNLKPSKEEYRRKVVEYMMHYTYTLESFKGMKGYDEFREYVLSSLKREVESILNGKNKDVEKRYKYYIMNEYI